MHKIYVVTHTESMHHLEQRVGGWYDAELSAQGHQQAALVAQRLGHNLSGKVCRIFSSDLRRAAQTADAIAQQLHLPVTLLPDLREMSYGEAEGKSHSWMNANSIPPPQNGSRLDHRICARAETRREFAQRIFRAMETISAETAAESTDIETVVVTHGFAVTFILMAWFRIAPSELGFVHIAASPGGISLLQEDDYYHNRSLCFQNDITHLVQARSD